MLRLTILAVGSLLSASAAAACETPYADILKNNMVNIQHLTLGMTKAQVQQTMTDCVTRVHSTYYTNPFRSDMVQKGGDSYEVMYYLTKDHPPFTPIRESQATPVVLKNGAVVGWGPSAVQGIK